MDAGRDRRGDHRVIALDVNVGMASLAGAVLLVLIGAGDESRALRSMPWGPILMVSGVTVLVALIEKTGGMDLFSALLARLASPETVAGGHRVHHGHDFHLQQHVGRRAAGIPADRAGDRLQSGRRRHAGDRVSDDRQRPPGGCLAALDDGRAVHCRRAAECRRAPAVPVDAGLGDVDGRGGGDRLPHGVRNVVVALTSFIVIEPHSAT